jgi:hypothetical protein
MAATTTRQDRGAGIVFPIATLSVVGVALALGAIGDDGPMLLCRIVTFISTLKISGDFAPVAVGFIGFAPFPVGVFGSRLVRLPFFQATSVRKSGVPRAVRFCIFVTVSLGLWWGLRAVARLIASALL